MKKNKGGRPFKYDRALNGRLCFSFRVSSDLERRLKHSAEKNKRSISEEIYHRLVISLEETNMLQEINAVFARYK